MTLVVCSRKTRRYGFLRPGFGFRYQVCEGAYAPTLFSTDSKSALLMYLDITSLHYDIRSTIIVPVKIKNKLDSLYAEIELRENKE